MSCCQCYNRSCPQPVGAITFTQNIFELDGVAAIIETQEETGIVGADPVITLDNVALTGFEIEVHINGVLQSLTTNYSINTARTEVTLVDMTLEATDVVQIRYAHQVT